MLLPVSKIDLGSNLRVDVARGDSKLLDRPSVTFDSISHSPLAQPLIQDGTARLRFASCRVRVRVEPRRSSKRLFPWIGSALALENRCGD